MFTEIYTLQAPQRGHPDQDSAAFCEADNQRSVAPLNKTNAVLEQECHDWLSRQSPSAADASAVALETHFFDTMRSYQERFDPPARLLPPPPAEWTAEMRQAMSAAPHDIPAIVLETMLLSARQALLRGDSVGATHLLGSIDAAIAQGSLPDDPLTSRYNEIVTLFIQLGYEPVQIDLAAEDALVIVHLPDRTRYQARLLLQPAGWRVATWELYQPIGG